MQAFVFEMQYTGVWLLVAVIAGCLTHVTILNMTNKSVVDAAYILICFKVCAVTTPSQVLPWDLVLSSVHIIDMHPLSFEVGLAHGQKFRWLGKMYVRVLHRKARHYCVCKFKFKLVPVTIVPCTLMSSLISLLQCSCSPTGIP